MTDLDVAVQERAKRPDGGTTLVEAIRRQHDQIALALPRHIDPERFTRLALTEVRRNPALLASSKIRFWGP